MTIHKNVKNLIIKGLFHQKAVIFFACFLTGLVLFSSRNGRNIQVVQVDSPTTQHNLNVSEIVTTTLPSTLRYYNGRKTLLTTSLNTKTIDTTVPDPKRNVPVRDSLDGIRKKSSHFINFQDIVNINVDKILSGSRQERYHLIDNTSNYRHSRIAYSPTIAKSSGANETINKQPPKNIKIIIVTYLRSGSTFTADLIQQSSDLFYLYEPLKPYVRGQFYFTLGGSLCNVINGTCRKLAGRGKSLYKMLDDVSNFYNCDLLHVPSSYFRFSNKSSTMLEYDQCRHNKTQLTCLKEFEVECKKSNRMIKTIRMNMDVAENLLKEFPQLKLIHLVRDPRGTYQSRKRGQFLRNQKNLEAITKSNCDTLLHNLQTGFKLNKLYPNRIKTVLYEDLAERPLEAARDLYKFLGLTEPVNFEQWVQNHTQAGYSNGYYDTVRRDSKSTAYSWRRYINLKVVQSFDKNCINTYKILGLNTFNSYSDLHNKNISVRLNHSILHDF